MRIVLKVKISELCTDTSKKLYYDKDVRFIAMLLFASQTSPGGATVILPALLITGLLVAASQAFVPRNDDQN